MSCLISKLEYYLPESILTNQDLERIFPEWSSEKISEKIGIKQRHITRENETSFDLALNVANKVLQGFDRSKIDFLLLCTQSPDYFLPTSACILQNRLGLNRTIGALDYNLGCSGYIYGLAIAKGLISAKVAKHVLLITSETYSKFIYFKDKANRTIFGDGASATIISESEKEKIFEFDLGTDGSGMKNLIVPNGAMRNSFDFKPVEIDDEMGIRTNNHLFMNGPEIFNFTLENVPSTVNKCLIKNSLSIDDVNFVIFHQANKYMLNHLRRKIKIPDEKFYINIENTGNTVSSTIPIALKDSMEKGIVSGFWRWLFLGSNNHRNLI